MIASVRDNRKLKALARAFNYRKHKVILCDYDQIELHGGAWDGGSRSTYTLWRQAPTGPGGSTSGLKYPTTPPQFGGGPAPTVKIELGTFIVQSGIFRGKVAHLVITGPAATKTFGVTE